MEPNASPSIERELLSASDVARLMGVSVTTVVRRQVAGAIPAALQVGGNGRPRWRRAELLAWIEAGCPSAEVWARRKE